MTADLVAFLRARLDEDHLTAYEAGGVEWTIEDQQKTRDIETFKNPHVRGFGVWVVTGENGAEGITETAGGSHARHIARHDPARVLAEVDAKRRIIEAEQASLQALNVDPSAETLVLLLLALPYARHPDYQSKWAPEG